MNHAYMNLSPNDIKSSPEGYVRVRVGSGPGSVAFDRRSIDVGVGTKNSKV